MYVETANEGTGKLESIPSQRPTGEFKNAKLSSGRHSGQLFGCC